ncbi:MAG: acetate--CoA ligase family protein [Planctomycetota bacterium]|nr:acetate--CoA ligase family protein [Planctomycetota bacterium]
MSTPTASTSPHALPHPEGLVLRDGSTANVRPTTPADREEIEAFLGNLGPDSGRVPVVDEAEDLAVICDSSNPRQRMTLVVTRRVEDASTIVAVGTYARRGADTAAISIVVGQAWRGIGIALRLLEKLAVLAAHNDFRCFHTEARKDDHAILETFRRSGMLAQVEDAGDVIRLDLTVVPDDAGRALVEMRDRLYTTTSIRPFFRPRAVAVVGAGRDPKNLGHRVLDALVSNRFAGPVYVINPNAPVVGSFPTHERIADVPDRIDLAIIVVPKHVVPAVIEDAADAGVRAVVVITAGFAETGAEGAARQQELVTQVRGHGMRMVGPNCMGLIDSSPAVRLAATFAPIYPPHGSVAMLSQSGALGVAILQFAKDLDLGLSSFVSVGNKADVAANDLLQYWEEDPETDVILLYLESFGDPRRFAPIARRVGRRKPVIAVKSGRSGAGQRAAGSHTASLAGSDVAVEALFRQTGMLRAETLEEMFHIALTLSSQPLPAGGRVAVLTNAGGPGILVADALEQNGLAVEPLPAALQDTLRSFLPEEATVTNPVDMIASAGAAEYRRAAEHLLASPDVDALIVIDVPLDEDQWSAIEPELNAGIEAGRKAADRPKPVLACVMGAGGRARPVHLEGDIPCFPFPEAAARVLARVTEYARWRAQPEPEVPELEDVDVRAARAIGREADPGSTGWLSAADTRALLTAVGLPVLPGGVARDVQAARQLADRVGYPVAVKLASQAIVHKTEMNGVHLDVPDGDGVEAAYAAIHERLAIEGRLDAFDGVLVQPMVPKGAELLVGVSEDPVFGPLVAFGLGGIHVEILQDVAFRVAPLTRQDAEAMVRGIRGARLLDGYRGHPPADVDAIHDVLLRVSRLVEEVPEITELDLNPLIAGAPGEGCHIVDARIRVRTSS